MSNHNRSSTGVGPSQPEMKQPPRGSTAAAYRVPTVCPPSVGRRARRRQKSNVESAWGGRRASGRRTMEDRTRSLRGPAALWRRASITVEYSTEGASNGTPSSQSHLGNAHSTKSTHPVCPLWLAATLVFSVCTCVLGNSFWIRRLRPC